MTSKQKNKEIRLYMFRIYKAVSKMTEMYNCDGYIPEEVVANVMSQIAERDFIQSMLKKHGGIIENPTKQPEGPLPENVVPFKRKDA